MEQGYLADTNTLIYWSPFLIIGYSHSCLKLAIRIFIKFDIPHFALKTSIFVRYFDSIYVKKEKQLFNKSRTHANGAWYIWTKRQHAVKL